MNASSIELTSCPVYEIESRAPTYFSKGRQIAPDENVFKIQRCRMIEFFECSVWPRPPIHYVLRYNFNRFHKKKNGACYVKRFPLERPRDQGEAGSLPDVDQIESDLLDEVNINEEGACSRAWRRQPWTKLSLPASRHWGCHSSERAIRHQPSFFFPKLFLLIGLLFAIISLFLPFKQRPYFIFRKKKSRPPEFAGWRSTPHDPHASRHTHSPFSFTDRKPRPSIKQQVQHFVISAGWQLEVRIYKAADRRLANHQSHLQLWIIQFLHIQPQNSTKWTRSSR